MHSSTTTTLHCCIRAINHSNSSGAYSQAPKHRRKAPPRTLLHSCLALLSCALRSFQALKAAASPLFLILLAMALQAVLRWWNCSQDSQAVATAWFCSLARMRSWMLPAALACTWCACSIATWDVVLTFSVAGIGAAIQRNHAYCKAEPHISACIGSPQQHIGSQVAQETLPILFTHMVSWSW